jgi:ATP-binding cassette subfamily B protein
MRETWQALRLIVSVALRADPKRAVASLIEPLSLFCFPFTAIGLQLVTNGAISKSTRDIIAGACVIGGIQAVIATTALIGNELRFQLRERIGLVLDQELVRLSAEIQGLEHHERPEYQDKLELVKQDESALGLSLNTLLNVVSSVCYAVSTLTVLALVHPALLFLALFAIPMIPLARLQQRWAKEGEDASAAPNRLARHLRALATDRNAGMELRVFGLQHELDKRFRAASFAGRRPVLQAQRRKLVTDIGRHVLLGVGYLGAVA